MSALFRLCTLVVLLVLPAAAQAQTIPEPSEERGYIQAYLEDSLSDKGRVVKVNGFAGVLSARATIEELTVADDAGIWLRLEGITLDWDRSALLRGVIDITELSAQSVEVLRAPGTDSSGKLPTPEAKGFALPELPVSVYIGKLSIPKARIGAPLVGRETLVSLSGSAKLEGGAGDANLTIQRIDGLLGTLVLEGSFANLSRQLSLAFTLAEGPNGIAAHLLEIPDRPSVDLSLTGAGPLSDFSADVALKTDGEERLAGRIAFKSPEQPATDASGQTAAKATPVLFSAEIGGDIAPVFAPEYRSFFGPDIRLILQGDRSAEGATRITEFSLKAAALDVQGALDLSPASWPERISLTGEIAAPDNAPVLLPGSGDETRVTRASFVLGYDRSLDDSWTADVTVQNLHRADSMLKQAKLVGKGRITPGDGATAGGLSGLFSLDLQGFQPADPALSRALGADISGGAAINWAEDAPLNITSFALAGSDYEMLGTASLQGLLDALNLTVDGRVALSASNLGRFDGLVGLPVKGRGRLQIVATGQPLAGTFKADISGTASDLGIDQPQIDPLLAGDATLAVTIRRDTKGTEISGLRIATDATVLSGGGALRTGGSSLQMHLALLDIAKVVKGATGPVQLSASAAQAGTTWAIQAKGSAPGEAGFNLQGTLEPQADATWLWQGKARLDATSIAPYSGLVGMPLRGGLDVTAQGTANLTTQTLNIALSSTTQDLAIGQPTVDALLRGTGTITTTLGRAGKVWRLEQASIDTPQMRAEAGLTLADDGTATATGSGTIFDIGLLAPGFSGAAQAQGTARKLGERWQIEASATGPGGLNGQARGTASLDGKRFDLALNGDAPLGLANRFIAPRTAAGLARYDLTLNGPVQLQSLGGTVAVKDARVALPNLRMAIKDVDGTIALNGGTATLAMQGNSSTGGSFSLTGPVVLGGSNTADITLVARDIGAREPGLYDTTFSAAINVKGPLSGGAMISGSVDLGRLELRIPDATPPTIGALPGLKHVNEPAAVRRTRARAGLLDPVVTGAAAVYGLDLLVRAPARIFVRGRGLDAELGGELRLRGTTSKQTPQGRFDLIRGRLDLLGRRIDLTQGYVTVRGDFNAYLSFLGESQVDDVQARVTVEGLLSDPVFTFSSIPTRPQDEVLSLLLFGHGLGNVSALQAAQLGLAIATLAGKGGEGLINKLRERFKLDDLDISTEEDGTTKARAGKYISDKTYSEVSVDSKGTAAINLNIRISPDVTVKSRGSSDGNAGVGVYFEKDY